MPRILGGVGRLAMGFGVGKSEDDGSFGSGVAMMR